MYSCAQVPTQHCQPQLCSELPWVPSPGSGTREPRPCLPGSEIRPQTRGTQGEGRGEHRAWVSQHCRGRPQLPRGALSLPPAPWLGSDVDCDFTGIWCLFPVQVHSSRLQGERQFLKDPTTQ